MSEENGAQLGPRNGWEVDAPAGDTAIRQFLESQTAFQRLTGEQLGGTVLENERYIAVDTRRPASMLNFALLRQPVTVDSIEQTMSELDTLYTQPGSAGWVALYSPLPTPDLSGWGWNLAGHPPLQLRSPFSPLVETDIRVEPVRSANDMAVFERIIIEGFDFGEMLGSPAGSFLPPSMLDDERFGAWLGFIDEEPVAGAASMAEAGIVDVVMVATVPAARRKGVGLAVTQAATRPELGLPAVLFSSDEGRPVYERLGYIPILRGSFWYRDR